MTPTTIKIEGIEWLAVPKESHVGYVLQGNGSSLLANLSVIVIDNGAPQNPDGSVNFERDINGHAVIFTASGIVQALKYTTRILMYDLMDAAKVLDTRLRSLGQEG